MSRLPALLLLPLAIGCAPETPAPAPIALPRMCGLPLAMRSPVAQPGSGSSRLGSGAPVRACALPVAADIESACRTQEGVPIPGTVSPDNPDSPLYSFPDYSVRGAACRFTDSGETAADCSFELTGAQGTRRIHARLIYRFRDLSNNLAHDWFMTGWEVDAVCAPR